MDGGTDNYEIRGETPKISVDYRKSQYNKDCDYTKSSLY